MPKSKTPTARKTIADFRALHDKSVIVPARIRAALKEMAKNGAEAWEYESDVIRLSGVAPRDFAVYRDDFADHIVETPSTNGRNSVRNVWFADPKVAKKVRGA